MHAKAFRLPTAALVIAGISIALLATASSASAATMSPASADFGRVLVGRTSAPVTFTVTKDSERQYPLAQGEPLSQDDDGGFVTGYTCLCFEELKSPQGDCLSIPNTAVSLGIYIQLLTATTPSCTITVTFHPEHPGPSTGVVFAHQNAGPFPLLTGIGLLSGKDFYCRKKHGKFVSHKKITQYCANRKG